MLAVLAAAALSAQSASSTIVIKIHIESVSTVTVLDSGSAMWVCNACGEWASPPLLEVDGEMVALGRQNVWYAKTALLAMAAERKRVRGALAQAALHPPVQ